MRIGPARDVAGSKYTGRTSLQIFINQDPAIQCQACLLRQRGGRPNAHAKHKEIGLEHGGIAQRYFSAIHFADGLSQMKYDAMLFMQFAHESADLRSHYALQWR